MASHNSVAWTVSLLQSLQLSETKDERRSHVFQGLVFEGFRFRGFGLTSQDLGLRIEDIGLMIQGFGQALLRIAESNWVAFLPTPQSPSQNWNPM